MGKNVGRGSPVPLAVCPPTQMVIDKSRYVHRRVLHWHPDWFLSILVRGLICTLL